MNTTGKLIAPKPIRKSSNNTGIKIQTYSDKNLFNVPHTAKNKKTVDWRDGLFSDGLYNINNFDSPFKKIDFDNELCEEKAKSEIFSILKNESTLATDNSFNLNDSFTKSNDLFFEEDEARTSMPPIRPQNPFHKNFQDAIGTFDDINLIKYNSSESFKKKTNDLD